VQLDTVPLVLTRVQGSLHSWTPFSDFAVGTGLRTRQLLLDIVETPCQVGSICLWGTAVDQLNGRLSSCLAIESPRGQLAAWSR